MKKSWKKFGSSFSCSRTAGPQDPPTTTAPTSRKARDSPKAVTSAQPVLQTAAGRSNVPTLSEEGSFICNAGSDDVSRLECCTTSRIPPGAILRPPKLTPSLWSEFRVAPNPVSRVLTGRWTAKLVKLSKPVCSLYGVSHEKILEILTTTCCSPGLNQNLKRPLSNSKRTIPNSPTRTVSS
jgi:hypothetical protein